MKATLEFSLPKDNLSFDKALNADKYYMALLFIKGLLGKESAKELSQERRDYILYLEFEIASMFDEYEINL